MIQTGAKTLLMNLKTGSWAGFLWKSQVIMGKQEDAWREKLQIMTSYEQPHWERGELVAGIDEAGRGPLRPGCGGMRYYAAQ